MRGWDLGIGISRVVAPGRSWIVRMDSLGMERLDGKGDGDEDAGREQGISYSD